MIFSLNFERYLMSVMQAVFVISFHRILIWSYLVYLFSDIWIWKRDKVLTMNICTYSIIYTIISTTQTTSQARLSTSASPLKHAVVPGSLACEVGTQQFRIKISTFGFVLVIEFPYYFYFNSKTWSNHPWQTIMYKDVHTSMYNDVHRRWTMYNKVQ